MDNMLRGHKIEKYLGEWIYTDTKTPCTSVRECGFCSKPNTPEGHDGCIGTLLNVANACCGHGVEKEAYVQFEEGTRIGGHDAVQYIKLNLNVSEDPP